MCLCGGCKQNTCYSERTGYNGFGSSPLVIWPCLVSKQSVIVIRKIETRQREGGSVYRKREREKVRECVCWSGVVAQGVVALWLVSLCSRSCSTWSSPGDIETEWRFFFFFLASPPGAWHKLADWTKVICHRSVTCNFDSFFNSPSTLRTETSMDLSGNPQGCTSRTAGAEDPKMVEARVGDGIRMGERETPLRLSPFRMLRMLDSCRAPGNRIGEFHHCHPLRAFHLRLGAPVHRIQFMFQDNKDVLLHFLFHWYLYSSSKIAKKTCCPFQTKSWSWGFISTDLCWVAFALKLLRFQLWRP